MATPTSPTGGAGAGIPSPTNPKDRLQTIPYSISSIDDIKDPMRFALKSVVAKAEGFFATNGPDKNPQMDLEVQEFLYSREQKTIALLDELGKNQNLNPSDSKFKEELKISAKSIPSPGRGDYNKYIFRWLDAARVQIESIYLQEHQISRKDLTLEEKEALDGAVIRGFIEELRADADVNPRAKDIVKQLDAQYPRAINTNGAVAYPKSSNNLVVNKGGDVKVRGKALDFITDMGGRGVDPSIVLQATTQLTNTFSKIASDPSQVLYIADSGAKGVLNYEKDDDKQGFLLKLDVKELLRNLGIPDKDSSGNPIPFPSGAFIIKIADDDGRSIEEQYADVFKNIRNYRTLLNLSADDNSLKNSIALKKSRKESNAIIASQEYNARNLTIMPWLRPKLKSNPKAVAASQEYKQYLFKNTIDAVNDVKGRVDVLSTKIKGVETLAPGLTKMQEEKRLLSRDLNITVLPFETGIEFANIESANPQLYDVLKSVFYDGAAVYHAPSIPSVTPTPGKEYKTPPLAVELLKTCVGLETNGLGGLSHGALWNQGVRDTFSYAAEALVIDKVYENASIPSADRQKALEIYMKLRVENPDMDMRKLVSIYKQNLASAGFSKLDIDTKLTNNLVSFKKVKLGTKTNSGVRVEFSIEDNKGAQIGTYQYRVKRSADAEISRSLGVVLSINAKIENEVNSSILLLTQYARGEYAIDKKLSSFSRKDITERFSDKSDLIDAHHQFEHLMGAYVGKENAEHFLEEFYEQYHKIAHHLEQSYDRANPGINWRDDKSLSYNFELELAHHTANLIQTSSDSLLNLVKQSTKAQSLAMAEAQALSNAGAINAMKKFIAESGQEAVNAAIGDLVLQRLGVDVSFIKGAPGPIGPVGQFLLAHPLLIPIVQGTVGRVVYKNILKRYFPALSFFDYTPVLGSSSLFKSRGKELVPHLKDFGPYLDAALFLSTPEKIISHFSKTFIDYIKIASGLGYKTSSGQVVSNFTVQKNRITNIIFSKIFGWANEYYTKKDGDINNAYSTGFISKILIPHIQRHPKGFLGKLFIPLFTRDPRSFWGKFYSRIIKRQAIRKFGGKDYGLILNITTAGIGAILEMIGERISFVAEALYTMPGIGNVFRKIFSESYVGEHLSYMQEGFWKATSLTNMEINIAKGEAAGAGIPLSGLWKPFKEYESLGAKAFHVVGFSAGVGGSALKFLDAGTFNIVKGAIRGGIWGGAGFIVTRNPVVGWGLFVAHGGLTFVENFSRDFYLSVAKDGSIMTGHTVVGLNGTELERTSLPDFSIGGWGKFKKLIADTATSLGADRSIFYTNNDIRYWYGITNEHYIKDPGYFHNSVYRDTFEKLRSRIQADQPLQDQNWYNSPCEEMGGKLWKYAFRDLVETHPLGFIEELRGPSGVGNKFSFGGETSIQKPWTHGIFNGAGPERLGHMLRPLLKAGVNSATAFIIFDAIAGPQWGLAAAGAVLGYEFVGRPILEKFVQLRAQEFFSHINKVLGQPSKFFESIDKVGMKALDVTWMLQVSKDAGGPIVALWNGGGKMIGGAGDFLKGSWHGFTGDNSDSIGLIASGGLSFVQGGFDVLGIMTGTGALYEAGVFASNVVGRFVLGQFVGLLPFELNPFGLVFVGAYYIADTITGGAISKWVLDRVGDVTGKVWGFVSPYIGQFVSDHLATLAIMGTFAGSFGLIGAFIGAPLFGIGALPGFLIGAAIGGTVGFIVSLLPGTTDWVSQILGLVSMGAMAIFSFFLSFLFLFRKPNLSAVVFGVVMMFFSLISLAVALHLTLAFPVLDYADTYSYGQLAAGQCPYNMVNGNYKYDSQNPGSICTNGNNSAASWDRAHILNLAADIAPYNGNSGNILSPFNGTVTEAYDNLRCSDGSNLGGELKIVIAPSDLGESAPSLPSGKYAFSDVMLDIFHMKPDAFFLNNKNVTVHPGTVLGHIDTSSDLAPGGCWTGPHGHFQINYIQLLDSLKNNPQPSYVELDGTHGPGKYPDDLHDCPAINAFTEFQQCFSIDQGVGPATNNIGCSLIPVNGVLRKYVRSDISNLSPSSNPPACPLLTAGGESPLMKEMNTVSQQTGVPAALLAAELEYNGGANQGAFNYDSYTSGYKTPSPLYSGQDLADGNLNQATREGPMGLFDDSLNTNVNDQIKQYLPSGHVLDPNDLEYSLYAAAIILRNTPNLSSSWSDSDVINAARHYVCRGTFEGQAVADEFPSCGLTESQSVQSFYDYFKSSCFTQSLITGGPIIGKQN